MINILICGNSGVVDGILMSSLSIAKHTDERIMLYIATMDLRELNEKYMPVDEHTRSVAEGILKRKNKDSEAIILDMTDGYMSELYGGANEGSHYTPYSMIRLLADMYPLPDKLLYIDTDVLACKDISELYNINIDDFHIGAVKDYYGSRFIKWGYVNSGVMLWNLAKMKEDGILQKARSLCKSKKMLLPDQSALNKYAKIKRLPAKYNDQHKLDESTVLQHFSMRIRWLPFRTENIKPWNVDELHERMHIHFYDDIIDEWGKIKREEYVNEKKTHTDIHVG